MKWMFSILLLVSIVQSPVGTAEEANSLHRMVKHSAKRNTRLAAGTERVTSRPILGHEAINAVSEDFRITEGSQILIMDDFERSINRIMPVIRGDVMDTNYAYVRSTLQQREQEGHRNALHNTRDEELNDCLLLFNSDLPVPAHHGAMVIARDIRRFGLSDDCHWHVLADGLAFFSGPISLNAHPPAANIDDTRYFNHDTTNGKGKIDKNAVFKAMRGKSPSVFEVDDRGLVNMEEHDSKTKQDSRRKLKLPRFRTNS